ncbi:MAG: MATE family efflux transporter, partial [bacterium]
ALLGTLWETFESFTEGIGEAAVIRVALHLGQGDVGYAKTSGYRSAILGLVVACCVTSIFWIFGHEIPQLFSTGKPYFRCRCSILFIHIANPLFHTFLKTLRL